MIKSLIIFFLLIVSVHGVPPHKLKKGKLALMNGRMINVYLAISETEQNDGLSGWKPAQLKKDEGMLFLYPNAGIRSFWMPNTFFNLDIIYFDKDLKVLKIDRDAPAHPSYQEPVPRLRPTFAHHILEVHAKSELGKSIQIGSQLRWMGKKTIKETLQGIRQQK